MLTSYIVDINDVNIYEFDKSKYFKIFVNGDWIGFNKVDIIEIIDNFKQQRIDGTIHPHTSIYVDYDKKK